MNAMLDDPTSHRVTVASCRDFRPDVIVGVGGSCMNKAKLVSLLLTHGAPLDRDYGEFKVPGPVIPVVAILTTALRSDAGGSPWFLVLGLAVYGVFDLAQMACSPGERALRLDRGFEVVGTFIAELGVRLWARNVCFGVAGLEARMAARGRLAPIAAGDGSLSRHRARALSPSWLDGVLLR